MTPWIDFIFYGTFNFLEHPIAHNKYVNAKSENFDSVGLTKK